jgi:hypothetical protein
MPIVSAYAIFDGTTATYVGDANETVQINCERVNAFSPRPVWLTRYLAPGQGVYILYQPTFDVNQVSADNGATFYDDNTLQGFWIEVDGKDVMIDAADAAAFVEACDTCCDDQPVTVTRFYTSGITAFVTPTTSIFCIARADNGSVAAHEAVSTDYLTQYIGNVRLRVSTGTLSHYQIVSYSSTIKTIGTDTVAAGACS